MVDYPSDVRRYDELKRSDEHSKSNRGELNKHFDQILRNHQSRYGGGGCYSDSHYPIDGPVKLYLTAFEGEESSQGGAWTTTVTLEEGDTATIGTDTSEYRIKFFGLYMDRPEEDQIMNKLAIGLAIDKWSEEDGCWGEVDNRTGTTDAMNWFDGQNTVRIVIAEAPGYEPEDDFINLIRNGLSPAEALDYWMADVRHLPQEEWAKIRGKTQQAISKNLQSARKSLGKVEEQ